MEEDLISPLGDDILISIISHLSLKEAITTSVLSHRWRCLWRFTSRLDFDISKIKNSLKPKRSSLNSSYGFFHGLTGYHLEARRLSLISRSRLIDSVNGVLESHQAAKLDEFTLCFDRDCKDHIDSWLTYALERRVKKLHLNFQSMNFRYTFSPHFLHNNKLDSITVIRFNQVSVADDVVDLILHLCPLLEVLSLRSSATLSHLKVVGPLKHLEILFCRYVKSVEISAQNLVSFKYHGPCAYIIVNDAPRLVEASIGDNCAFYFLKYMPVFSDSLSRLQTFKMDLRSIKIIRSYPKFPMFNDLKHLDLVVDAYDAYDLICCTSFLMMCPSLHGLKMKIVMLTHWLTSLGIRKRRKVRKAKPHHYLKMIELGGFLDLAIHVKLAEHLLKRAVSLEKLIIDPCASSMKYEEESANLETMLAARARAKHLETSLPPKAELVIL